MTTPSLIDLLGAAENGSLGYCPAHSARIARELRRARRDILDFDIELAAIPAEPEAIDRYWPSSPPAGFTPGTYTRHLRILKSACLKVPGSDRPVATDARAEWTALESRILAAIEAGILDLPRQNLISLRTLARLAAREHRGPSKVGNAWILETFRKIETDGQKKAIKLAIRILDLAGEWPESHLPDFLAARPRRQRTAEASPWLEAAVADYIESRRKTRKKGFQKREVGRAVTERSLQQYQRAVRWYYAALVSIGLLTPEDDPEVADLAVADFIQCAVEAEIEEVLPWKGLAASTLANHIFHLLAFLREAGFAFRGLAAEIKREHEFFDELQHMSEARKDWCLSFLANESLQIEFFDMPATFSRAAQSMIEQDEMVNPVERARTLDYAIAAATAAILTNLPLRIGNLLQLPLGFTDDKTPAVDFDVAAGTVTIFLPARYVKNRVPIRHVIAAKPPINPAAILAWFVDGPRKLILQQLGAEADETLLFGGLKYHRFRKAWLRASAEIGLGMTPHLVRHAIASFLLAKDSGKRSFVRALLRVSEATMARNYEFAHEQFLADRAEQFMTEQVRILRSGEDNEDV